MRLPRLFTVSLLSALPLALSHTVLADTLPPLPPTVATVVFSISNATTTYFVPLSPSFVTYTNNVSNLTENAAVRGGADTAVQASVSSTPGYSQGDYSVDAYLSYVFQVAGPANQTVGVNISANGQVTTSGSGGMFAEDTLSIGDGSEEFPQIYLDPCENQGSTGCGDGTSGFVFAQPLDVLTNTNYYVLLDAEVGGGSTDIGSASAFIDPTITLNTTDPAYSLVFSPGLIPTAATPEPSSLLLLGTGLVGAVRFARRKSL